MNTTKHRSARRGKRPAPSAIAESAAPADSSATPSASFIEPDRRHAMISHAAYYLSERRDFRQGYELDDWFMAEREVDQLLSARQPGNGCGT